MITGADLDHIALAVERWADAWPVYARTLGGVWKSGGRGPGFAPAQLRFANDMRVELIEPNAVEQNDFLRRFLDRHGAGPHHLTYKVPDIEAALAAAEAAGITPVGVDLRDPEWKEAFLHPSEAMGIVVQLAEAPGPEWSTPPPEGFPTNRADTAELRRIVHVVRDLPAACALFVDLLGGREIDAQPAGKSVEVAWPGPGRLQLVEAGRGSDLDAWLGERSGRVHQLHFISPSSGAREIEPHEACGVLVRITPDDDG